MTKFVQSKTTISFADDHVLFRESVCNIIDTWEECKVICQVSNGCKLIESFENGNLPDLTIVDLRMPEMNGFETVQLIKNRFSKVKVIVISYSFCDETIKRLLLLGVDGFINKSDSLSNMKYLILQVIRNGSCFTENISSRFLIKSFYEEKKGKRRELTDKDRLFLKYICTDKPYKLIAMEMGITNRHAEYLRNCLFERFNVKSRVELAVIVLEKGISL